jgi:medium-chain acyl-[acyl-carrier-protein] hydrolase
MVAADKWLARIRPSPQARVRLFCFPYAGGGGSVFFQWAFQLPELVEVCAVQLPGRESRFAESPVNRMENLTEILNDRLDSYVELPFAFFGHSMGGLIAFELARKLRTTKGLQPRHLFASGCRAPQLPLTEPPMHTLPDEPMFKRVEELGGTPADVLKSPELLEIILPALRADLAIVETYAYKHEDPLECGVTAFSGLRDRMVTETDVAEWEQQTRGSLVHHKLPGDHFFIHSARTSMLNIITADLAPLIEAA